MSEHKRSRRPKPALPGGPKDLAKSLRNRDRDPAREKEPDHDAQPESVDPPAGPVIRRAVAKDLGAVLALRALMFSAMGASTAAISDNTWQRNASRWLQLNLGDPRVNITVADVNGSAVACALGEVVDRPPSPGNPNGLVGMLGNVATFPEYRMTGLGQACVDAVMDWFREETDVSTVELVATPGGHRRYAKHGFREHEFPHLRVTIDRSGADG